MDSNIIERISEELQEGIDAVEVARDAARNILKEVGSPLLTPGSIVRFESQRPYIFVANVGEGHLLVIDLDHGCVVVVGTPPDVLLPWGKVKFAIADYVGKESSNA